ncbi:IclR family transcriptional regulator [Ideonella alba]|uniref:Helix-turn-helix domain-containing protein n=1 Tax=Ideonella alba TaxID=2824118 RepID=A0A940Y8A2_9BURK|nr:helix-turn-helix domain-containing protein [Ideonella alba]MBQ0930688.1 helix-turn-helix domain-containing protein [Ideonella alba]
MSPPVKSALRVLELLEFFAEERRPASVGEVAQALHWPQSSTSVLLRCLVEAGYVDHDRRSGLFAPGVRVALATAWMQEHLYTEHSLLRLMEGVREATGHTVMIGERRGVQVRYLHVLQSTHEGRFTAKTGSLRPLFGSAAGRMLLTTLPPREIGVLLRKANALEPDPARHADIDHVLAEVAQARREGYAESTGTSVPGAAALAVLIPVGRQRPPLTLSVGGPQREVARERTLLLQTLRAAVEPLGRTVLATL